MSRGRAILRRSIGIMLIGMLIAGCGRSPTSGVLSSPVGDSVAGTDREDAQGDKGGIAVDSDTCPGVGSALVQILDTDYPLATLEQLGYPVNDGRAQIVVILAGEDLEFLDAWDVVIGSQSGDEVQIFARPEDICHIALSEGALAVRLPSLAVPQ